MCSHINEQTRTGKLQSLHSLKKHRKADLPMSHGNYSPCRSSLALFEIFMLVQDTQCSCGHSQAEETEYSLCLCMCNSYSIQQELWACVGRQSFTVIRFTAVVLVEVKRRFGSNSLNLKAVFFGGRNWKLSCKA